MKKYGTLILCILALLLCMGAFAACREKEPPVVAPDPVTLSAPTGLEVVDDVLTWTPVEGAVGYTVACEGEKYDTDAASLDVFCIADRPGVKYSFTVTAKGDGKTTLNSAESEAYTHSFLASSEGIGYILSADGVTYLAYAEEPEKLVGKIYIPGEYDNYLVTGIASGGFKDCNGITGVVMNSNVERIGALAFANCTELRRISFPWMLTEIGASTFENCTKLEYVQLPESLASISYQSFKGCDALASLTVSSKNRNFKAELNCLFKRSGELVLYVGDGSGTLPAAVTKIGANIFMNSEIEHLVIHEGITEIGEAAFLGSAIKDLTLPSTLESIGQEAFANCLGLTRIVIEKNVEMIDARAFYGCTNVTYISIPGTVREIGVEAFAGLGDVAVMLSADVRTIGSEAFGGANMAVYTDLGTEGEEPAWPIGWGTEAIKQGGFIAQPAYSWKKTTVRYCANCLLKVDEATGGLYVAETRLVFGETGMNDAAPGVTPRPFNKAVDGIYAVGILDNAAGILAPVREGYTFLGWSTEREGAVVIAVRLSETEVTDPDSGETVKVTRYMNLSTEDLAPYRTAEGPTSLYPVYQKNA